MQFSVRKTWRFKWLWLPKRVRSLAKLNLTDYKNLEKAGYRGEVKISNLDLGTMTKDPVFGKVALAGTL
jgi:hypothetical protein